MPGIIDDIIIKRRILEGMFEAAEHEGREIEKHGLLYECTDLDNDLRAAYVQFRDVLHNVIDEMEARVTQHVVKKNNKRNNKS